MDKMGSEQNGEGIARIPQSLARDRVEQVALDAEHLVLALTAVAATRPELTFEAGKHRERLRFAVDRLEELRGLARQEGGVFTPGRAEVALSILEGQVALTAAFINRMMKDLRRRPGRREALAAADETVAIIEDQDEAAA